MSVDDLTRLGRYRVQRELASGGMGSVVIAFDEQLQRQVAIKRLYTTEKTRRIERFEQEARIIAQLQHPNIVQVYDYGVDDEDMPYLVMELLEGEELSKIIARDGPLPLAAVASVVTEAARGLHVAHHLGVVHRDLKPANLFLSRKGGERILKILDFGIATMKRAEDSGKGGKPKLVGTPSYMSPEQAQSKTVDHRADLWSLAVVAYHALTGVIPFAGRSMVHTVMQVVHDPHAPPSTVFEGLGPSIDAFFERALSKDIDERFSSASEFAAAFAALVRPADQRPSTILVVDDEPDVETLLRRRFRRLVRRGEYELLFAGDGEAALDQLALRPDVDVVLTDLNMPGMDGLTLLRRLGQAGPALRTVVLSAYDNMANIRAAMNAGAYDFLTKPLDFDDLEATLAKAVRDARTLRRALSSIEENDALRLVVDDALMDRLLPLLRVSGDLSGETIDATIVSIDVCDMRGRVRDGAASAAFQMLNRTFDRVIPIVGSRQGIVVNFVGDAALILFQGFDHLRRAASACVAIQRAAEEVVARGEGAGPSSGGRLCIGLASGPVASGNIGSRRIQRLNYTVMGEVVSHAIALEKLAGAGQILVRRDVTIQLAPHFECSELEGSAGEELGVLHQIEWNDREEPELRPGTLTLEVEPSE